VRRLACGGSGHWTPAGRRCHKLTGRRPVPHNTGWKPVPHGVAVTFSFSAIRREPRPISIRKGRYSAQLDLTSAGPPFGPVPASVDRPSLVIGRCLSRDLDHHLRGGFGTRRAIGVLSLRTARRSPAACHGESRSDRGQLAIEPIDAVGRAVRVACSFHIAGVSRGFRLPRHAISGLNHQPPVELVREAFTQQR
jgi:hypothetical protein